MNPSLWSSPHRFWYLWLLLRFSWKLFVNFSKQFGSFSTSITFQEPGASPSLCFNLKESLRNCFSYCRRCESILQQEVWLRALEKNCRVILMRHYRWNMMDVLLEWRYFVFVTFKRHWWFLLLEKSWPGLFLLPVWRSQGISHQIPSFLLPLFPLLCPSLPLLLLLLLSQISAPILQRPSLPLLSGLNRRASRYFLPEMTHCVGM